MRSDIDTVAREVFGWPRLRPGQREAIESVLAGVSTLAVMPTGSGKSAIYQIAGLLLPGPTVVVSPLIALEFDQVASIAEHDAAPRAVAVNSSQGKRANEDAWRAIGEREAEYLLVSPEQLANDEVVERLRSLGIALFVVDEAHCVAAWGHDFRPDYLRLADAIESLGHPTVLGLTATASPPVRDEIIRRLGLSDAAVLTHGFDRPNLRLDVVRHEKDTEKREAVLETIGSLPKPGLAYVATRRDTEAYASELESRGLRAFAYHAGLSAKERRHTHERFQGDEADVVIATSAFGMGIDKPDVRFVTHASIPDSLDSYYQEVGRAGRDGGPATVTLHYRSEDLGLVNFFASGTPDHAELQRTFSTLRAARRRVRIPDLAEKLQVSPQAAARMVNLLEQAGAVDHDGRGATAMPRLPAKVAAERAVRAGEERERIERSRVSMMRSYAETRSCRRQFLLGYFGENLPDPCGNCDTCASGSAFESETPGDVDEEFPVDSTVTHAAWGSGTVMSYDGDRLTVFFDSEGYKVLSLAAVREAGLLKPVDA